MSTLSPKETALRRLTLERMSLIFGTSRETAAKLYKRLTSEEMAVFQDEAALNLLLTDREAYIVSRRAGGNTLHEVADFMELTRERIRQIENKALRKLKYASARIERSEE